MSEMRKIEALNLPGLKAKQVRYDTMPVLELVDPKELFVDEKYQRELSDRSIRLIRKIAEEWNWHAFKPPICARVDGVLHVVDGQHTAIGAATGFITRIPVVVHEDVALEGRADSFVRHNRDRINVTPLQLHRALVAAGDEDALTIDKVCSESDVTILVNPPAQGRFKEGETMAIKTIQALVSRRHFAGAKRVLKVCASAKLAPISADAIRAVETLLFDPQFKGDIVEAQIADILRHRLLDATKQASLFAAERKTPLWRALASIIFINRKKWKS